LNLWLVLANDLVGNEMYDIRLGEFWILFWLIPPLLSFDSVWLLFICDVLYPLCPMSSAWWHMSVVDSSWNVIAHGDTRDGKWRGNWRMEWLVSTLHTTSEHGVSSITTADSYTSAASGRLNWRPRRFKWARPFHRKTKSGFCACAITFQLASTNVCIYFTLADSCLFLWRYALVCCDIISILRNFFLIGLIGKHYFGICTNN
jgi:hypothetical protein